MNIVETSSKIKEISQNIEQVFLSLADRFPALLNKKGGTSLEDLLEVLQDLKQNGENSSNVEDNLFNGFEARYSSLYTDLNKKIDDLNELDSMVKEIKNDSEEMELITLNAMVISIKSGEKGLAFSCITENLKRLSNQMLSYANHLLTEEGELLKNISDLEGIIKAVLDSQKKLVLLGNSSNAGLQALIGNSSLALNEMKNQTSEVYIPIQKTMEGLQLQDIIRQALDHVLLCLKDYTEIIESGMSFEDKLDTLCFDIEILQISQSVLADVMNQLQELTSIFNTNWTTLTKMLNEIEQQRKEFLDKYLAENGDNSDSMLLAIERIQSKFSSTIEEFNNFQTSQKNLEFTCQSITQWANSMNRTFEDLSPVIANLHHVRVMQGIEVAKNEAISSVRDSVIDMDNYIKSANTSLDGMQKILQAFSTDTKQILSSFTKKIENDNKQMKNLKNIKSAFFNQLGNGYTTISDILHNFKALPEGFEQDCNEVSSNLNKINLISESLNLIDSEIKAAISKLQSQKSSILNENQIASWEIRDNRLKELITHFTITAHKEAAGKIGGFGIEKEGAKSGEITFF